MMRILQRFTIGKTCSCCTHTQQKRRDNVRREHGEEGTRRWCGMRGPSLAKMRARHPVLVTHKSRMHLPTTTSRTANGFAAPLLFTNGVLSPNGFDMAARAVDGRVRCFVCTAWPHDGPNKLPHGHIICKSTLHSSTWTMVLQHRTRARRHGKPCCRVAAVGSGTLWTRKGSFISGDEVTAPERSWVCSQEAPQHIVL